MRSVCASFARGIGHFGTLKCVQPPHFWVSIESFHFIISIYFFVHVHFQELKQLADEVRAETIHTVSKTGGHLGSSLGVVELTVALHHVFNCPEDKFLWDVGHQVCSSSHLCNTRGSEYLSLNYITASRVIFCLRHIFQLQHGNAPATKHTHLRLHLVFFVVG